MILKRKDIVLISVASFLMLFGLPIVLSFFTVGGARCWGGASAQDNPCLAQEATNSALQLQFQQLAFQATLDSMNHQATVTALQSGAGGTGNVSTDNGNVDNTSPGLPFFEDFSDNSNGWRLSPGVSLASGILNLEDGRSNDPIVPVPPVSNFYLALEVIDTEYWVDIFVGDFETGNYHMFRCVVSLHSITVAEFIANERNDIYHIEAPYFGTPFTCAVDYQDGQFDMYVNDEYIMTGQLTTYGGAIALGGNGLVQIDNLEIRVSR